MYISMMHFRLIWIHLELTGKVLYPWMHGDETIVTVEDVEDILSSSQKEQLKALLSPVASSDYCQQEILSHFAIAKSYVHHHQQ